MKTKKLIKAIKFIKRYCANNDDCFRCLFWDSNNNVCYFFGEDNIYAAQWDVKVIKNNLKDVEEL
jgi:hypothetical protein